MELRRVGRVRARVGQLARGQQLPCWFPRRFSLRPDVWGSWALGQSGETKGARSLATQADRQSKNFTGDGSVLPLRGGVWGTTSGSGVFAFYFSEPRAYSGGDVGFRAAFLSGRMPGGSRAPGQSRETKGARPLADLIKKGKKEKPHGSRQ